MPESKPLIRRARRTDFTAVMHLLAGCGVPIPPPDRATLRRFRNLVNDLGGDFYVALVDGSLVGLVHVTYARELVHPPVARLESLLVASAAQHDAVAAALLAFAHSRAAKRGCGTLRRELRESDGAEHDLLAESGLQRQGEWWSADVRTSG